MLAPELRRPYITIMFPGREGTAHMMSRYHRMTPHEYAVTEPYNGCAECGFGPGAYFHNTWEVQRWNNQINLFEANASLPIE